MRKLSFILCMAISSVSIACMFSTTSIFAAAQTCVRDVYIGGMPAGFSLQSNGVQIVGICEILTESGLASPAANCGLRTGDVILKINGISLHSISQLNELVESGANQRLKLEVERGEDKINVTLKSVKDKATNRYKIGILARDSVSGIGTITYIDKESGRFGALGHTVVGENRKELRVQNGNIYECSIVGVHKGLRGKAGELRGMFLNDSLFGTADKLCKSGIFGQISVQYKTDGLMCTVANSMEVMPGKAQIYSTVEGISPQCYQIEIVKVDKLNRENKNYVIKITDEALLSQTGGIVQGMSGSPIIQNGKMVGAVTHVFLNDPTRGYGIDINAMLIE